MPKVEIDYEENDELAEVLEGVKIPKSIESKILQDGNLQSVRSLRRLARERFADVLPEDFEVDKAKPSQILDAIQGALSAQTELMEELRKKAEKPPKDKPKDKDEPLADQVGQVRELQDQLAQAKLEAANQLKEERKRNTLSLAMNSIKGILKGESLDASQEPLVSSMIGTLFEASVDLDGESPRVVYRKKGEDTDFYVNGNLATEADIAAEVKKAFPKSFASVAQGGGNKKPGKSEPTKGEVDFSNIASMEREAWGL